MGRAAAEAERVAPPQRRLQAFEVDATDTDVVAYEPLWLDGRVQGFCTSGGYAHWSDMSIALAFVPTERVAPNLAVEIELLGERRPARLITECPFDPGGERLRG